MASTLDPERRAALYRAKLGALVTNARGPETDDAPREPRPFAGGAALLDGSTAWVLIEAVSCGLGSAMAWAAQQAADELQVIVSGDAAPKAGALARQAAHFAAPPKVWGVEGSTLVDVEPAPVPDPVVPPPAAVDLADQLRDAGLDVVVEHGVVCGEVFGLEVARVVIDGTAARIEVGVGPNDREAFAMLHGNLSTPDALKTVADKVLAERRPGRPSHPLNRIAAERWLRSQLLGDPDRFAGWALVPVPGLEPRASLNDRQPAFAVGHDDRGAAVVVACSVGIDLDLVPVAADARHALDPTARLVLAVPERDAHEVTRRLARALHQPAELLVVEGDWR